MTSAAGEGSYTMVERVAMPRSLENPYAAAPGRCHGLSRTGASSAPRVITVIASHSLCIDDAPRRCKTRSAVLPRHQGGSLNGLAVLRSALPPRPAVGGRHGFGTRHHLVRESVVAVRVACKSGQRHSCRACPDRQPVGVSGELYVKDGRR